MATNGDGGRSPYEGVEGVVVARRGEQKSLLHGNWWCRRRWNDRCMGVCKAVNNKTSGVVLKERVEVVVG